MKTGSEGGPDPALLAAVIWIRYWTEARSSWSGSVTDWEARWLVGDTWRVRESTSVSVELATT